MLSVVTSPTLVIAGACDEATPVSHAEDIVTRIEGAQLSVVPDAGHIANVEQPAVVTALLIKHLEGD
jgi:3-oxoadipate enol-lactonase